MYLRSIGRHFTQMNAYFLVMNGTRCKVPDQIEINTLLFWERVYKKSYFIFSNVHETFTYRNLHLHRHPHRQIQHHGHHQAFLCNLEGGTCQCISGH